MRRSSIFLLLGAVLLGLLAVVGARGMMARPDQAAADVPQNYVVVAAEPIKFGTRIEAVALKSIPWPGEVPENAFSRVRDAVQDGNRTALRDFRAGEPLLDTAITGELGRLASSAQLGADMRAMAIAVDEISGAGGFVAPGDRVDILLTRNSNDEPAFVSVVAQGLQVLAVGQGQDPAQSEPKIVKSLTLEVTPVESQKITLAQTVGSLSVVLRGTGDEARIPAPLLSASEAFGVRPRSTQRSDTDADVPVGSPSVARPGGPEVHIVRGTDTSSYRVAR